MQQSRRKEERVRLDLGRLVQPDAPHRGPSSLFLDGGRIVAVSPPDPEPAWPETRVVDRRDCWAIPGFVQTHVHLCQTLFRGAAEGRSLRHWLEQVVWPCEAALDSGTMEASATLGVHLLAAGGTTTILDMGTTHDTEALARVVGASGIRAFLGPAVMDRGPQTDLLRDERTIRDEIDRLAASWSGFDEGRVQIALCPRFVPSVSDGLYRRLVAAPEYRGFLIHTHGSETREEVELVRSLTGGQTPIQYLTGPEEASGRLQIAHAVWITEEERNLLRATGSAVSHCPSSNLKLGSGLCDVIALQDAGVAVGLGADGAACNNRLDPWVEMRLAALLQSLTRGPAAVDPAAIFRLANLGGAEALGIDSDTGSLVPGKWADIALIDPAADPGAGPEPLEGESLEAWLIYSGSSALVRETWVQGNVIYRREDEPEWQSNWSRRLGEARGQLLARAGLPASIGAAGIAPSAHQNVTGKTS